MTSLSKEQYKMLLRISRYHGLNASSLDGHEIEICKYLLHNSFVKGRVFHQHDINGNAVTTKSLPANIEITQAGEAALYEFKSQFYKWWIPVIISIISVALSSTSIISQVIQLL